MHVMVLRVKSDIMVWIWTPRLWFRWS